GRGGVEIGVDDDVRTDLELDERLEQVTRDKRDAVTGFDLDRSVDARLAVQRGVVRAVASAVDGFFALIRRVEIGVARAHRHGTEPGVRPDLHALTARLAEVPEEA